MIAQVRWEVELRFFFQKQRNGIRQLSWNFELNQSKGSGVIEIPKKISFGGGVKGLGQKNCLVFIGPNGNCLQILGSISPKKRTDRQTDILLLLEIGSIN